MEQEYSEKFIFIKSNFLSGFCDFGLEDVRKGK